MSRRLPVWLLIVLNGLASGSQAGILTTEDWKSPGDHLLLSDSQTGLEWLKLDASLGLSHASVISQLNPSGLFSGFRYATSAEIATLANDAGITIVGSRIDDPSQVSTLLALGFDWCWTFGGDEIGFFGSFFVADNSGGKFGLGEFFVSPSFHGEFPQHGSLIPVKMYVDENLHAMEIGSALVRETSVVPEPTSLILWSLLAASTALLCWRRRLKGTQ